MLKSAGRFILDSMKTHFNKTCYTPNQLINLLKERGLIIPNEKKASNYLTNIGYFRLSGYFYPLLKFPKEKHLYKDGATFYQVMNIYRFDRKFRLLLFNEIEKIEVAIRSCITNFASLQFGDLFWLTDNRYFSDQNKYQNTLVSIDKELQNSKEDFISHFRNTYLEKYPPSWMITEIIPFGSLAHIYLNLKDQTLKKKIAQHFGLQPPVFTSWLIVIGGLRNMCCHHSRMWNRELPISPAEPKNLNYHWINPLKTDKRRMYYRICMIRYFLYTISPHNTFKTKIETLLNTYPGIDVRAMGFPENWQSEPIWEE